MVMALYSALPDGVDRELILLITDGSTSINDTGPKYYLDSQTCMNYIQKCMSALDIGPNYATSFHRTD